ncbi:MAG: hypothetical protein E7589_01235 [Ruminococcaceae bacterium]|nr:hypothetical protein [Oscillospiraceae bacterium]
MNIKEETKVRVGKYNIYSAIIRIPIFIAFIIPVVFCFFGNYVKNTKTFFVYALICAMLGIVWCNLDRRIYHFLGQKYLSRALDYDLNADLFKEIVKQTKMTGPMSLCQLTCEYITYNYSNCVSMCHQKLRDSKADKKHKHVYFAYLAHVYFDIGDIENLREICKRFQLELVAESAKTANKIRSQTPSIMFYERFVQRAYSDCYDYISYISQFQFAKTKYQQVRLRFREARIALDKGENETAAKIFQSILQEAPNLNLAELARHGLESIEKGIPYKDTFEKLEPNENYKIIQPTKRQKTWAILQGYGYWILVLVSLLCSLVNILYIL